MTDELELGHLAPDFRLPDATGAQRSLSDYRGRKVIVYFYPAAFTSGCTTEACDFRDNLGSLEGAGYTVLGISPDSVDRLREWTDAEQLTFTLLSDEGAEVAKTWGAWGQKTIGDRTFDGLIRSTMVVDEDGRLESIEYNVDPNGHVARLREALAA
jgi:peroxiredoxin Q/BCP